MTPDHIFELLSKTAVSERQKAKIVGENKRGFQKYKNKNKIKKQMNEVHQ